MKALLVRRLAGLVLTLAAASLVVFAVLQILPGDPAMLMLDTSARPDTIAALRAKLGLDQPAWWRYLTWIGGMMVGDLGVSYTYSVPVSELVGQRLMVTLPLAVMTICLSVSIAIPVGVWAAARRGRAADAAIMAKIGSQSSGVWLGGWNADVQSDVSKAVASAKSQNATATFVAYNIPGRDCGQYSAGGLSGKDAYLSWIKKISSGIGSGNAIVILEPDALSLTDCLSEAGKADRYATLSEAADILASNPGTKVYLDAGHSGWINSSEMASRLSKAGVSKAAGFSLNVSNFVTTADNVAYGTEISKATGGKHFVVDTSRNGSGSNGEWCNPSGRSLGQAPTLSTGNSLVDAYLWAKKPGESDGNCNGGPSAGTWWPEYALDLAKRSGY